MREKLTIGVGLTARCLNARYRKVANTLKFSDISLQWKCC